ncbi:MAG: type II secretion system secretin GspD [Desulfobulbaceae bacterium]|nr:type II secretion system secretin GspD [Desulfobulbaceae bacterium]
MNVRQRLAGLSLALFLGLTLMPGTPLRAAEKEKEPARVTINFQDVDIAVVAASIAKITGRTFIIDPRVKGKVTIFSAHDVPEKDVYPIFLAILQVHDFTAAEDGQVTKIIPLEQAKHDSWSPLTTGDSETPADGMVTTLIALQHVAADKLVAVLRPLLSPKSYLASQPDSNMLIISDRAGNIARLQQLVSQLDQDRSGEIEVIKLQHAAATDVVKVLTGLTGQPVKAPGDSNSLKLIADERTNSVILSGSAGDRLQAKALIAHLDSPIEVEGDTQVVFLKYAKAKDLTPILTKVEPAKGASPGQAAVPAGAAKALDFSIQADEATNALIITAPATTMKSLQAVIRKLDIRRPQVQIEAVIAEIVAGNGAELGVQWRATDVGAANDKGLIGGTNFAGSANPGINALSASLSAFGNLSGFNLGYLKGTTTILGSQVLNLGALVSALASDGNSNILSTPSLVTMDNQEAEIVVGQNVPFATGSYTSSATSSNNNPFTTYERKDVGLKLKVTPQINEGDTIRLDILQEVSNLSNASSDVVGLQTTSTRSIKTNVMVDDGHVLVLGGLISDDIQESVQKVPLLGDIPYLGWLFRYTKSSHNKRNLMVFLRPTILRDQAQGSRITFDKYDYMRRLQQERGREGVALLPQVIPPVLPAIEANQ